MLKSGSWSPFLKLSENLFRSDKFSFDGFKWFMFDNNKGMWFVETEDGFIELSASINKYMYDFITGIVFKFNKKTNS